MGTNSFRFLPYGTLVGVFTLAVLASPIAQQLLNGLPTANCTGLLQPNREAGRAPRRAWLFARRRDEPRHRVVQETPRPCGPQHLALPLALHSTCDWGRNTG